MRLTAFLKSRQKTLFIAILLLLVVFVAAITVFVVKFPTLDFLKPQKVTTSSASPKFELYAQIKEVDKDLKIITVNQMGSTRVIKLKIADNSKITAQNEELNFDEFFVSQRIKILSPKALEDGKVLPAESFQEIVLLDPPVDPSKDKKTESSAGSKENTKFIP